MTASAAAASTPIDQIRKIIVDNGYPKEQVTDENIIVAYNCNFASKNVSKAVGLLQAFIDATNGRIEPIVEYMTITKTNTEEPVMSRLQGADNRNGVTCYLDSLLFCLFARQTDFEPILSRLYPTHPELDTLATLLRMYVNLMRRGKHITTDITKVLISSIIKAGWEPSAACAQQDTFELFSFITDVLSMPMLTLKLEIAHEGLDSKEDDHKFVNERMLLITIPGNSEDPPITLEECMENYFQNSVQVFRQLARRKTLDNSSGSFPESIGRKRQLSVHVSTNEVSDSDTDVDQASSSDRPLPVHAFINKYRNKYFSSPNSGNDSNSVFSQASSGFAATNGSFKGLLEYDISSNNISEKDETQQSPDDVNSTSTDTSASTFTDESPFPTINRDSAPTNTADDGLPSYSSLYTDQNQPKVPDEKPKLSTLPPNNLWTPNKEFSLPAWMFLQIVPFYTNPKNSEALSNPQQVTDATETFVGTRPVVAIALKRSTWNSRGEPILNGRKVMVPPVIHVPSFVADGDSEFDGGISASENYVLVLEGAVFHRGTKTTSGHFVSVVREKKDIRYADQVEKEAKAMGSKVTVSPFKSSASSTESVFVDQTNKKSDYDKELNAEDATLDHLADQLEGSMTGSCLDDDTSTNVLHAHERWLFFDDLLPADKQVQEIDYDQVFSKEKAYLLFYRLVTTSEYLQEQSSVDSSSYLLDRHNNNNNTKNFSYSAQSSLAGSNVDFSNRSLNKSSSALAMMNEPDFLTSKDFKSSALLKPSSISSIGTSGKTSNASESFNNKYSSVVSDLPDMDNGERSRQFIKRKSVCSERLDEPGGVIYVKNTETFSNSEDEGDDDENEYREKEEKKANTHPLSINDNVKIPGVVGVTKEPTQLKTTHFLDPPTPNKSHRQHHHHNSYSRSDGGLSGGEESVSRKSSLSSKTGRSKSGKNRYSAWASLKKSMSRDSSPSRVSTEGRDFGELFDKKDRKNMGKGKKKEKGDIFKSISKSARASLELGSRPGVSESSELLETKPNVSWNNVVEEFQQQETPYNHTARVQSPEPTSFQNSDYSSVPRVSEDLLGLTGPSANIEKLDKEKDKKSRNSILFFRPKGKAGNPGSNESRDTNVAQNQASNHHHHFSYHRHGKNKSLSLEETKAQEYRAENCVIM